MVAPQFFLLTSGFLSRLDVLSLCFPTVCTSIHDAHYILGHISISNTYLEAAKHITHTEPPPADFDKQNDLVSKFLNRVKLIKFLYKDKLDQRFETQPSEFVVTFCENYVLKIQVVHIDITIKHGML